MENKSAEIGVVLDYYQKYLYDKKYERVYYKYFEAIEQILTSQKNDQEEEKRGVSIKIKLLKNKEKNIF